jgi:hypothetical protein
MMTPPPRSRPRPVSQAVMKQFGGGYGADGAFADEAEAQQHSKLEKLYISTRAAKVNGGRFPRHRSSLVSFILQ